MRPIEVVVYSLEELEFMVERIFGGKAELYIGVCEETGFGTTTFHVYTTGVSDRLMLPARIRIPVAKCIHPYQPCSEILERRVMKALDHIAENLQGKGHKIHKPSQLGTWECSSGEG